MSELSRYSARSLIETKSSDRTRKFPITFCLGEKVSFYFTDQDFPLLLSFTLLVLHFIHNFFAFVTATSVYLSHRGLLLVMETLQNFCTFPES